jgi:periplasmic protein TonB
MDFARQQRNPTRNLIGIGGVILLHIIIVYALLTGLARKIVEVVKGPIEVKVIEEVAKKPPPPPEVLLPPPKLAAPPPPYMPPPEVQIAAPQTNAPTITAVGREAPTAAQNIAPQRPVEAAPAPRPVPRPAPPAVQSASVACANYREVMGQIVYPRNALKEGIEGEVLLEFTVNAKGEITDETVKSSTNRIFNSASLAVLKDLKCDAQGRDVRVQAPISFKLN